MQWPWHLLQNIFGFFLSYVINMLGHRLLSGLRACLSHVGFFAVKAGLCPRLLRNEPCNAENWTGLEQKSHLGFYCGVYVHYICVCVCLCMCVHVCMYIQRYTLGICSIYLIKAAQTHRTGSQFASKICLLRPSPAVLCQRRYRVPGGEQGTKLLVI